MSCLIKKSLPISILKNSCDVFVNKLTDIFNSCIKENQFPDSLKLAEITPIFKKSDDTNKENYRPISILSKLSKVFEKILHKQISEFMEEKFSKLLCGFRKKHNTQSALLNMIENWKKELDKGNYIGAIIMDLSKAFDTINHNLLLAKLGAYGFELSSIKLLRNYLSNRKQRTKINGNFSSWMDILCGVPQGSILGPLLFNIFINDIFNFVENTRLCNYADDNTLYSSHQNYDMVRETLKENFTRW